MKQNITLSYSINRSFIKSDIYIFEALGYNVQRILSRPHKSTIYFIWNRTQELLKSLLYIPSSKIVVSWFNDYHALIPIILSKIFFKKSVIIVGGYDAIVDVENKDFSSGTIAIAKKIGENSQSKSLISIVGGGDTLAAIKNTDYQKLFTHLSTAGGAFLESLEGKQLPGVKVLTN